MSAPPGHDCGGAWCPSQALGWGWRSAGARGWAWTGAAAPGVGNGELKVADHRAWGLVGALGRVGGWGGASLMGYLKVWGFGLALFGCWCGWGLGVRSEVRGWVSQETEGFDGLGYLKVGDFRGLLELGVWLGQWGLGLGWVSQKETETQGVLRGWGA